MFSILKLLKQRLYLIIPLIFLFFWAFLSLLKDNFNLLNTVDFPVFYNAGKNIFTNPDLVYSSSSLYFYLPSFATIFSLLTLIDYAVSQWIFFFILLIFSVLSIIEFDKILRLKNVESKFNRFLFLIVLCNGLKIMNTFDYLQPKFIVLYLILLFVRREIEARNSNTEFRLRFCITQLTILIFALCMVPSLFFILIIYLFNNIKIKEIFSKDQLKKYFLAIVIFVGLNFMFLVYPSLISDFISRMLLKGSKSTNIYVLTPQIIVNDQLGFPINTLQILILILNLDINVSILSIIIMIIIAILLALLKNGSLEKKIGYIILFSLFFNVFTLRNIYIVLNPLLALLLVINIENIKDFRKISEYFHFIKQNFLFLLGLICISILYFLPPIYYIFRILPITQIIPLQLMLLIETFIYIVLTADLYLLKNKPLQS